LVCGPGQWENSVDHDLRGRRRRGKAE